MAAKNRILNSQSALTIVVILIVVGQLLPTGACAQQFQLEAGTSQVSANSNTDSVWVFADSVFGVVRPLQMHTSRSNRTIVGPMNDSQVSQGDTVAVRPDQDTTHLVNLKKTGVLRIDSEPESALVSIGMNPVGMTPMVVSTLPGDTLDISVTLPGYQQWTASAISAEGGTVDIRARLEREEASLSVVVDPPDASVLLDGTPISKGSVRDYLTSKGPHHLVVRDDSTGRSKELVATFSEPRRYFFRAKFGAFLGNRVIPAFLVPGCLDFADGQYVRGSAVFIGTVALAYLAVLAQNEYVDRVKEYDNAMSMYVGARTEAEATRRHEELLSRKDDLDKYFARRTVAFSLFVGAYVYSLVDAFLNHFIGDVLEIVPLRDVPGLPFPADTKGAGLRIKF